MQSSQNITPVTLWKLVERRARETPSRELYVFYKDQETREVLTCAALAEQSRNMAAHLWKCGVKAYDRCLLMFEQGNRFILAFFACKALGAIPVPLNLPRKKTGLEKWEKIAADTEACCILTSLGQASNLRALFAGSPVLQDIPLIVAEESPNGQWEQPYGSGKGPDIAFLQYTSGSTGEPKGVMVGERCVAANMEQMRVKLQVDRQSTIAVWLPYYHDMGLIGGVLLPLYAGARLAYLNSMQFVAEPLRWAELLAVSHATHTAGPNFAYATLARALEQRFLQDGFADERYSLQNMRCAFCGSEPVNLSHVLHFQQIAERYGMHREAMKVGYGLAESSLIAGAYDMKEEQKVGWAALDAQKLSQHQVCIRAAGILDGDARPAFGDSSLRFYVGAGFALDGHRITIRNSLGELLKDPFQIGEICISGPSITLGYWKKEKETNLQYCLNADGIRYFRTGDLGFLTDAGELFITGREKEVLILGGCNYYPSDVEKSVSVLNPAFVENGTAAFSVQTQEGEWAGLVQEVTREAERNPRCEQWAQCIRKEIIQVHGFSVRRILFVRKRHIPRTTSGKIQRARVKQWVLEDKWEHVIGVSVQLETRAADSAEVHSRHDCTLLLQRLLHEETGLPFSETDEETPFPEMGITSVMFLSMAGKLEERFHVEVTPALFFTYYNMRMFSAYLWSRVSARACLPVEDRAVSDR